MAEKWISPDEAVELIHRHLKTSIGHAQALLRAARASGEVRFRDSVHKAPALTPDDGLTYFDQGLPGEDDLRRLIDQSHHRHAFPVSEDDLRIWLARNATMLPKRATPPPAQDYKRQRAEEAIKALWPKGAPSPAALPNKPFCNSVREWIEADCKARGIPYTDIKNDTILRAAERKY